MFSVLLVLVTVAALGPPMASAGWQASFELELVSVASDGTLGNSGSYDSSLSFDGENIAFESSANNLVPNDTNANTGTPRV